MMKKLTVGMTLLLSGYSSVTLAYLPGLTSKIQACTPSYRGGLTLGLTGILWRPSSTQSDYGLTFPGLDLTREISLTEGQFLTVEHDRELGGKASIGYVFPYTNNDINLIYTKWNNDARNFLTHLTTFFPSTTSPFFGTGTLTANFLVTGPLRLRGSLTIADTSATFIAPPLFTNLAIPIPFDASNVISVVAHSHFENDSWDLNYGSTYHVGCHLRLRWFGGVRYSHLKYRTDVTQNFSVASSVTLPTLLVPAITLTTAGGGTVVATDNSVTPILDFTASLQDIVNQKSSFAGVGPQVGFDVSYAIGKDGFAVQGCLISSLLIGEVESTFSRRIEESGTFSANRSIIVLGGGPTTITDLTITSPIGLPLTPVVPVQVISFEHPEETRMVPNIDAKIGVNWTYHFKNCTRTTLMVEGGYMVSEYFNALDRLSSVEAFAPEFHSNQHMDISFDGPYLGARVNF